MQVCADTNLYIPDRKYRRNYVLSRHMRCKGVYPRPVSENICAETSGDDFLDNSLCYLDQRWLLCGDCLGFDIWMYSEGKDMAPIYPGSMHQYWCPDLDHRLLERRLGYFHLNHSPSLHPALTNTIKKETRCFGGICDRTPVNHLFTKLLRPMIWLFAVRVSQVFAVSSIAWKISSILTNFTAFKNKGFGGAYRTLTLQPLFTSAISYWLEPKCRRGNDSDSLRLSSCFAKITWGFQT